MNYRIDRISEEIKKIVSDVINNELKDPRIASFTSVLNVKVTKDLRYAKVYISVIGSDEMKKNTMDGLKSAAGFMRKEIGRKINTFYTPEIIFEYDESIEHAMKISKIIDDLKKEGNKHDDDE